MEIHIQPVLPPARLLIYGVSPTARALVRLGKAMGYAVTVIDVPWQSDFTKLLREVVICVKRGPLAAGSGERGRLLLVMRPGTLVVAGACRTLPGSGSGPN